MIRKGLVLALCCGLLQFTVVGCGGNPAGDVALVAAGGTVTLNGQPLEGANISFVPEKGPIANGVANKEGKFSLATGTSPGAPLGPCQVTITAAAPGSVQAPSAAGPNMQAPPKNEEEVRQRLEAMNAMKKVQTPTDGGAAAGPKSRINAKYANPKTSGLTATIDKDPAKNQFTFEVTE